jgi:hypothetical protein
VRRVEAFSEHFVSLDTDEMRRRCNECWAFVARDGAEHFCACEPRKRDAKATLARRAWTRETVACIMGIDAPLPNAVAAPLAACHLIELLLLSTLVTLVVCIARRRHPPAPKVPSPEAAPDGHQLERGRGRSSATPCA